MRVTSQMQINNMLKYLNRRSEKLYQAETIAATGKGVNTLSDDPATAGTILADRSTVSTLGKYQSIIDQAKTYMEVGDTVLESAIEVMHEAISIATEESAGDLTTREDLVETLEGYYAMLLDLANTQLDDDYLYGGSQTNTKPFANETTVTGGVAEDLLFDLADAAAAVTIEITNQAGDVVRTLTVTGGTAGTNTVAWDGLDDGGTAVPDGDYGYAITAVDTNGDDVASCPSYRGGDASKTIIMGEHSSMDVNNDGGDIFSDALMVLQQVITVMGRTNYDPAELSALLDDVNDAVSGLESDLVALSVQNARLETADDRMEETLVILEEKLAAEWTYDADQAAVELQTLETSYEITLETTRLLLNMPNLVSIL